MHTKLKEEKHLVLINVLNVVAESRKKKKYFIVVILTTKTEQRRMKITQPIVKSMKME